MSDATLLADWTHAPSILDGSSIEMTAEECGVEFWLRHVAQGSLRGKVHGRDPASQVPEILRTDGPLRDALISEMAFRALSEDAAVQACAQISASAQTLEDREFYATQTLDEARHARVFRHHLVDLGVPEDQVDATVEGVAGAPAREVLEPLWAWGVPAFDDNFINGVVIVTVLLEGVLAPTTELSERKWGAISPATADVERGAGVDELRHLAVGSSCVRRHLDAHPGDRDRLTALIAEGRQLWADLPTLRVLQDREALFQEGLAQHADAFGDAEIEPGRRIVDTTPEERLETALRWSLEVQTERLAYMGLDAAPPEQH